eukprot:695124-Rhodomonas_salina.3
MRLWYQNAAVACMLLRLFLDWRRVSCYARVCVSHSVWRYGADAAYNATTLYGATGTPVALRTYP